MLDSLLTTGVTKLIEKFMDFSMQKAADRLSLESPAWVSIKHDVEKMAEEAMRDLLGELKMFKDATLELNPWLKKNQEELERMTSAMLQLANPDTQHFLPQIECEWEKDAVSNFFSHAIKTHPDWKMLKEHWTAKLESFGMAYRNELLHSIRGEAVNTIRLEKEWVRLIDFVTEAIGLWGTVFVPHVSQHFRDVEHSLSSGMNPANSGNQLRTPKNNLEKPILIISRLLENMIKRIS